MASARTDRRWEPVLTGGIYCSRACGFKCTKAAYDRAVRDSAALCKLLGEGWEPHVWENGGWHYDVKKGPMRLHVWTTGGKTAGTYSVEGYSAEIVSDHAVGRDQLWPDTSLRHQVPQEAIDHTLAVARGKANAILAAVAEIEA